MSDKQKTALTEIIEWCKREQKISMDLGDAGGLVAYTFCEQKATELLSTEKSQIVEAHIAGQKFASDNHNPDSEEFYNQTYNK